MFFVTFSLDKKLTLENKPSACQLLAGKSILLKLYKLILSSNYYHWQAVILDQKATFSINQGGIRHNHKTGLCVQIEDLHQFQVSSL